MNVVHLTDSPFFGGPERQMLGLAENLPASIRTTVLCFRDRETCAPFLDQLGNAGVAARMLGHSNPHFAAIVGEVAEVLRSEEADLLICHGYKADLLGWFAARRVGIPVVAVSRGWTAHTWKVRLNEALDRRILRRMDRVVCVSGGQAEKVRRAGVAPARVSVIHNAIDDTRFAEPSAAYRWALRGLFASPPEQIVLAIGRLSPEKGFEQLVAAARLVVQRRPRTGFVLVGDGPERGRLQERIDRSGMQHRFVLAGFRTDVDKLVPHADVVAQSSYTEGLPNVILEACAAGRPVVATSVGGTPEVVRDGMNGYLVPAGDPRSLAMRLLQLLEAPAQAAAMGARGRELIHSDFSFTKQSAAYERLFDELVGARPREREAALV